MHSSCKLRKESIHFVVFYGVVGSNIELYLVLLSFQ